jgi:hypothetical protein
MRVSREPSPTEPGRTAAAMYRYVPNSNVHHSVVLRHSDDWSIIERFIGDPLADTWRPIPVDIWPARKRGNFPSLIGYVPCFDRLALAALEDLLSDRIEALPLSNPTEELFAINVLDLLDCLDHRGSSVDRFPDDNSIADITHFAFLPGSTDGHHIFKLRELPRGPVIVSEEFRNAVRKKRLVGLLFEKLP